MSPWDFMAWALSLAAATIVITAAVIVVIAAARATKVNLSKRRFTIKD